MSKRLRSRIAFAVACVLVVATIGGGAFVYFRDPDGYLKKRLNVLVVSSCSVRRDHFGLYDPEAKKTPKIDKWAQGAFIFDNAIAMLPWENFGAVSADKITFEYLRDHEFRGFPRKRGNRFIIPPTSTETTAEHGEEWYWDEKAILSYQESLEELKNAITRKTKRPFYVFTHLKYMHYPYYDDVNMGPKDWARLSPKSQELLKKYVEKPLAYDVKLPVIELMLNSFDLLKKKFGTHSKVLSTAGIVSDPARSAALMKSAGFEDDVRLVKELYDLKMERFDDMASDVLNLFGDKEQQDRTIVLYIGDHGEALMDHGVLGHSVNVYEEMVRYPLMVKFPGQSKAIHIEGQTNHRAMSGLVLELLGGEITPENFVERAKKYTSDFVISRNCADTIRSVRYRSEWKLIKNLDSGKDELYDLKADSGEKTNVIEAHAEMAWKLEEYLIEHQKELHDLNPRQLATKVCL